ncbi:MAG: SGNH/GDSL hydrolase family protein [Oscillospiraceae bacterium]|jgi:lysophospholipase L1-like esterase|nr:SGNH/GDSL hydrolase family protein [Oscillospiraceae bacterium]
MRRLLFQGDSVTDCGRRDNPENPLGGGYPKFVAETLVKQQTPAELINRGISGNRVRDLRARWAADVLELRPDLVSILIGINDTWRRYDQNDETTDAAFAADYRAILDPLAEQGVGLLLLAPFVLDVSNAVSRMREDLAGKQAAVRRLAAEYGTLFLDTDALFQDACREQMLPPAAFAADGVHPTEAGHRLLAKAWLRTAEGFLVRG